LLRSFCGPLSTPLFGISKSPFLDCT